MLSVINFYILGYKCVTLSVKSVKCSMHVNIVCEYLSSAVQVNILSIL